MDAQEGQHQFHQADALFRAGDYEQALEKLQQLARVYPDQPRLLYPMALCLAKLGRSDDALQICDVLLRDHGYEKARGLKHSLLETVRVPGGPPQPPPSPHNAPTERLDASAGSNVPPPAPPAGNAGTGIDPGLLAALDNPPPAPPPLPADAGSELEDWNVYLITTAVCVVIGVVIMLGALAASDGEVTVEVLAGNLLGVGAATLVGLPITIVGLYLGLMLVGALPSDDFKTNLADLSIFGVLTGINAGMLSLIGFIVNLFLTSRRYQLSCGQLFLVFLVQVGVGFALFLLLFLTVGAAFFALFFPEMGDLPVPQG